MALCQVRQYENWIAFDNELATVILNHFVLTIYNHCQSDTRCLHYKSLRDSAIVYALWHNNFV